MRTTAVIPTYNEASNLPTLIGELWALDIPDLHVIIVDDNSPDGTGKVADQLARDHRRKITVIHREGKLGLGSAYRAGFQLALARGADAVIQMDADFSHSPSYIPILLGLLDNYDVVVGSRYVKGGKLDDGWGLGRYLLSWWANNYTRLILGLKVKDTTAGFKIWRRTTLEEIDLSNIHSKGYDFQVEMAYIAQRLGCRVHEYPIYFQDRQIGTSKMSMSVKLEAAWRVWELRWRYRQHARTRQHRQPA